MMSSSAEHLRRSIRGILVLSIFAVSAALFNGCAKKEKAAPAAIPPAVVELAKVEVRDITPLFEATGRTDRIAVNIVPRVRGYLEEICFKEGDFVKEGDVLYKIEDFDYKNAVETAKARIYICKAQVDKTKADYDRQLGLNEKGKGFTTQEDIDRTKALYDEAVGNLQASKVNLDQAQKDLERTVIKAPCDGKIDRTLVEVGDLLDGTSPNPVLLTTLMPMDPMYVYFEITDTEFALLLNNLMEIVKGFLGDKYDPNQPLDNQDIRKILQDNNLVSRIEVELQLPGDPEGAFPHKGVLTYSENMVNRATGSMTMRAEFANHGVLIYPGYIGKVRIKMEEIPGAVLVKERALCYDLNEIYVWVLDKNGKPQRQNVVLGRQFGGDERIITSGLKGGETYILNGVQKVRAGCDITEKQPETQAAAPAEAKPAEQPQQ